MYTLFQISASSIDRLLAAERRNWMLRGRSGTKPGTLLKHQIPIRTFADWNEKQAGFVENGTNWFSFLHEATRYGHDLNFDVVIVNYTRQIQDAITISVCPIENTTQT
jgi:hypothetical protein